MSQVRVTDKKYEMHGTLKYNLDSAIMNVKYTNWDCLAIVSGTGMTRTGKTMLAGQCAYYFAYNLGTPFNVKYNVCFDGQTLINRAKESQNNTVFIYDEAREGLNSKNWYSIVSQNLNNFFSAFGKLNDVVFVVLPDYFDLQKSIALSRSRFLLNVYTNPLRKKVKKNQELPDIKEGQEYIELERGRFSYYDIDKKKNLYIKGKQELNYLAYGDNFWGDFREFWVWDENEYDVIKDKFLRSIKEEKGKNRYSDKYIIQRNILINHLYKKNKLSSKEIANLFKSNGISMTSRNIRKISKEMKVGTGISELDINTNPIKEDIM